MIIQCVLCYYVLVWLINHFSKYKYYFEYIWSILTGQQYKSFELYIKNTLLFIFKAREVNSTLNCKNKKKHH